MNNTNFQKFFEQLGLDSEQAKIIRTLIPSPPLTVAQVAEATKINRTTCYRILDEMKKQGLVDEIKQGSSTMFVALSYEELSRIVESRIIQVDELVGRLQEVRAELYTQSCYVTPTLEVRTYRGTSGIHQMMWNLLDTKSVVHGIHFPEVLKAIGPDFYEKWYQEFKAKGLKQKCIVMPGYSEAVKKHAGLKKLIKKIKAQSCEVKFATEKVPGIQNHVEFFDDTLMLFEWDGDEIVGTEITSKTMVKQYKTLFKLLWKSL